MAKVILHIGDKVTHSTLGEGVVTIVDDEFVTIKFATDELTFRLPDAFRNGFLTSEAAIISGNLDDVDDEYEDEEEEDDEEDEEEGEEEDDEDEEELEEIAPKSEPSPVQATERKVGLWGVLIALAVPFPVAAIIGSILLIVYLGDGGGVFLFLFILTVLIYLLVVIICIRSLKKPSKPSSYSAVSTDDSASDAASTFFLGMVGGAMLDRALRKDKRSIFDKAHDDFLWQEKIRRDMRDDGFNDW